MTDIRTFARGGLAALLVVLVAGCTSPVPGTPATATRPDPDRMAAVRAIRAIDAGTDSALQVTPLRDAAVEGFLERAELAEQQNRFDDALAAIVSARKLAPDAPGGGGASWIAYGA